MSGFCIAAFSKAFYGQSFLCIDSIEPAKNYVLFVNWLCKHQSSLLSEVIKAYLLCSRSTIMAVLLSTVENVALFTSADRIVV